MKNIIIAILLLITISQCVQQERMFIPLPPHGNYITLTQTDTVIINDTVFIDKPVVKEVVVIDTFIVNDTVISKMQYKYQGDNYTAYISGYRASLDSLQIYNEN